MRRTLILTLAVLIAALLVCVGSLDTQGRMTLQLKGGGLMRFQAIPPQEVCW